MLTLERRKEIVEASLRAAATLASQTAEGAVKDIWRFIEQYACLVEPVPSTAGRLGVQEWGWAVPSYGRRRRLTLRITALDVADVGQFSDVWDRMHAGRGTALFFPRANLIVLRADRPETPAVIGSTLLHEGGHALRRDERVRAGHPDPPSRSPPYLREERDMHTLEGTLWRDQNPSLYDRAMEEEVSWVCCELRREGRLAGEVFVGLPRYPDALDGILGSAPSAGARRDRKIHFDILVNFAVVDRCVRSGGEELKAAMMGSLYEYVGFTGTMG